MITYTLVKHIKSKDFDAFLADWEKFIVNASRRRIQNFLINIIDGHYNDFDFDFYVKIFDVIIDKDLPLDCNIKHYAPTFLSLAVDKSSRKLFDYFLQKGAGIDFIGDRYSFETKKFIKKEVGDDLMIRDYTCLDFAELKYADATSVDFDFKLPEEAVRHRCGDDCRSEKMKTIEITVKKCHYCDLLEQVEYLHGLINTGYLIDYIKSLGGKTYIELESG
ncbi:MAG TPA: hypothetical protein PKW80_00185 [Bacteroidales bacterium]|nr:hypothetical protein [Bacteroidales bacterium]